jgi:hypothetical protein
VGVEHTPAGQGKACRCSPHVEAVGVMAHWDACLHEHLNVAAVALHLIVVRHDWQAGVTGSQQVIVRARD